MYKLDIRTKIFILVIANILMFKMMSVSMHLIVALCFSIYLGVSSNYIRMSRFFGIYLFFTAYEVFFAHTVTLQVIDSFLLLTALMFKTLYFPLSNSIMEYPTIAVPGSIPKIRIFSSFLFFTVLLL